jgi:hypothetical protein
MSLETPAQPPRNHAAAAAADGGSGNLIAELEDAITGRQMQQRIDILAASPTCSGTAGRPAVPTRQSCSTR